MKSVQLTGIKKFEIRDVPRPRIHSANDVLVKIAAVGVCGSDIHYYTSGRIGNQIVSYPFPIGHECAGVVEEIGGKVTRVKKGDRIAVDPAVSCNECEQCLIGRKHTCRNLKFLGCPGQLDGCLSEYIIMPEESCFKIHDPISLSEAVLVEPLSIGIYAVEFIKNSEVKKIAILGAGPIGMSVLLAAQNINIQSVYISDKIEKRLQMAQKAGAGWIGNPDKEDIVNKFQGQNNDLLDAVFECCGQQEALDQAVELLKPGGILLILGIPGMDRVSFDISKIRRKEIAIQNVRRQNNCMQKAIELVEDAKIDVKFMATHHFKFEHTAQAFELVDGYRDGVLKAIIQF